MCRLVYTHKFPCCQLRRPRSNSILVAKSTLSTQVLVSNTILPQKEPGFPREVAESRAKAGKIQDKTGASYCAIK